MKRKSGIAMFSVIFVFLIISTLAIQFHFSSRQAQQTANKFLISEVARQITQAAMEEAFMAVHTQGIDPTSPLFTLIRDRDSSLDATSNSSIQGREIPLPLLSANVANVELANRFNSKAYVRIVDFRACDSSDAPYYQKEGVGTLEFKVITEPKSQFAANTPGSAVQVRHHDYKITSIVTKRDNNSQRTEYSQGYCLDYALFIRNGQWEFEQTKGLSYNPTNQKLTIDQSSLSPSKMGKVFFGNTSTNKIYLNIDGARGDFLPTPASFTRTPPLTGDEVFSLLPLFEAELRERVEKVVEDEGADLDSFQMLGHQGLLSYQRLPITNQDIAAPMQGFRDTTEFARAALNGETSVLDFSSGVFLEPSASTELFLEGDVRQRFFHYAYFTLDLSNAEVIIEYSNGDSGTIRESLNNSDPPQEIVCFDYDEIQALIARTGSAAFTSSLDLQYLKNNFASSDPNVVCRIDTDSLYSKSGVSAFPTPDLYHYRSTNIYGPLQASVPFAHANLWSRRNLKADMLKKLEIYDGQTLKLHGIVHVDEHVTLGESGPIRVEGQGVLIAKGITINAGITKAVPNSDSIVAVLATRGEEITVNTNSPIEASLVSMSLQPPLTGRIKVTGTLDLKGALAVDILNLLDWTSSVEHKISYDPALKRTDDMYQISLSRWVTFERMIEKE